MILAVIFAILILLGVLCIVAAVQEQGFTDGENFMSFMWGLGFLGVGLVWPVFVGGDVRTASDDAPLIFLGDWIRGCMHLQASAWEWLKEATGF